jgi:GGDEF domain-containing protein
LFVLLVWPLQPALLTQNLARTDTEDSMAERTAKPANKLLTKLSNSNVFGHTKPTESLRKINDLRSSTGLHNRRFGEQSLKEAAERSAKTGDNLAIVLIDLDYFKEINDQFGHATGDLALKEFSRSLRRRFAPAIRPSGSAVTSFCWSCRPQGQSQRDPTADRHSGDSV